MATPKITKVIAPNGDLTITVGITKQRFLVWPRIMCNASPVWNSMLDPSGHFNESMSENVDFPEDDSDSFHILLQIAHLQLDALEPLDIADAACVAVLGDKYDMIKKLRLFIESWARTWTSEDLDYELTMVTWHFGRLPTDSSHDTFFAILKDVVMNSYEEESSVEPWPGERRFAGWYRKEYFPPGLSDHLLGVRKTVLAKLRHMAGKILGDLNMHATLLSIGCDGEFCRTFMIGYWHESFEFHGLVLDAPGVLAYDGSVATIAEGLKAMSSFPTRFPCQHGASIHQPNPFSTLAQDVQQILDERLTRDNLVPAGFMEEMAKKAPKY